MKSKLKVSLMLAVFVFSFALSVSAHDFSDVKQEDWFYTSVNYVTDHRYFSGTSESEFSPSEATTRSMFITALGRMADIDLSEYTKAQFSDVPIGRWYSIYVNWAASSGIISGYDDGLFHPDYNISREEIAVIINRYLTSNSLTIAENPDAISAYSDEDAISDWAKPSVALMRKCGVFTGDRDGNFCPKASATRAEMSNIIMRLSMALSGDVLPITTPAPYSRSSEIIDGMTLTEKVFQMFFVTPEQLTGVEPVTVAGETTREAITSQPVGGLLYNAENLENDYQVQTMLKNTSEYAKITPFLAIGEEGGSCAPMADKLKTVSFESMYNYRNERDTKAYEIGAAIARDMVRMGFNQNFAPVADILTNINNSMIADRAFSTDSNTAAAMVAEAVRGMNSSGIISTLKYFPGYGDVDGDAHLTRVYSNKTLTQLRNCEFVPFKSGINAGADFVMCANINLPEIDSQYPATMSYKIVTEILKDELGFKGVVITDALNMNAVRSYYTSADTAVKCIQAGCDMLLSPDTFSEAVNSVITAVHDGTISEERINESVKKILDIKLKYGIIS